jgi:phosphohistidine phosphatase
MRHAHATAGADDGARPLSPIGRLQARAAGAGLARLGWDIVRVVASPARRCQETAAVVATALGVPAVETAPELALDAKAAAARDVLLVDPRSTLAVGHAPDLACLVRELLGCVPLAFECAAAVGFEVDVRGRQASVAFLLPRDVLAALGSARAE